MSRTKLFLLIIAISATTAAIYFGFERSEAAIITQPNIKTSSQYIVLAWNDLGMHCYNPTYQNIAILPPYNNLWAQVIKEGNPPTLITQGITITYSIPGNTYSADKPPFLTKTNFWTYCPELFKTQLDKNTGLTGNGLSGTMKLAGNHFEATGIPLTEFLDRNAQNPNAAKWTSTNFQLAQVIVTDSATGKELARTTPVTPVSTELNCANCHSDDGDATTRYPITPTGNVDTNILAIHDYIAPQNPPLSTRTPVLCANCHSSNALGMTGTAGVKSLSNAMHGHHFSATITDITPDTDGCYQCHPGPNTQCLRDTMSQNFGFSCVDCHGNIGKVSQNTNPWLNEPRCDDPNCHGAGYTMNNQLFKMSTGHGGLYCEGCHGSTHAISPSREANDEARFIALQGSPGPLRQCTVCHNPLPQAAFKHNPASTYAGEISPTPLSAIATTVNNTNQPPSPNIVSTLMLSIGLFTVASIRKIKTAKKT